MLNVDLKMEVEVKKLPKLLQFILRGHGCEHLMAIYPMAVEIFKYGPKW